MWLGLTLPGMKQILYALLIAAALPVAASAQVEGDGGQLPFSFGEPPFSSAEPPLPFGEPIEKGDSRVVETERSTGPSTEAERRRARLDTMFDRLARAETEQRANRIARNILQRMTESGSDTVDLLMSRAGAAMQAKNNALALDYLDGVVRLKPDFAEGWNRRATVHFQSGDYGRSLLDIETTLRLEPRHFGALSGLAMILVAVDKKAEALDVMNRTLEVHPFLPEIVQQRDRIELELDGARI